MLKAVTKVTTKRSTPMPLDYHALGLAVIKQALKDLQDPNIHEKLDAFWFLTEPNEDQMIWIWLAEVDPDKLKIATHRIIREVIRGKSYTVSV